MSYSTLPELFPEEKKMPLAKYYYNYPMHDLGRDEKQILEAGPMDPGDAIKPENFIDLYRPCGEYDKVETGYCMFPDGSGYVATYTRIPPGVELKKMYWYLGWLNTHSRSMVLGHGNLRYKIWNPPDHWDHHYVNWVDKEEGVFTTESLDLGEGDRKYDTIRHEYNLRDFGLTDERIRKLTDSGYKVKETAGWETFDFPGSHLCLAQIRPCPTGGHERRSREWIGWKPSKGKLIRDPSTPCNDAYLKKVVIHTLMEWNHVLTFVNELYDEYHDQPIDAD
jgi:hypothetical protein